MPFVCAENGCNQRRELHKIPLTELTQHTDCLSHSLSSLPSPAGDKLTENSRCRFGGLPASNRSERRRAQPSAQEKKTKKSPVREINESQSIPVRCRCWSWGESSQCWWTVHLQNVLKLHFKRRTSATCLPVLRCAVAGVRRCGSSVQQQPDGRLGQEETVKKTASERESMCWDNSGLIWGLMDSKFI